MSTVAQSSSQLAGGCVCLYSYMAGDREGERGCKLSPCGSSYKGC